MGELAKVFRNLERRPSGVAALAIAHFVFGLVPLVWLLSILTIPSSSIGGGGEPAEDVTAEAIFGMIAIAAIVLNALICVGLGYGLWRRSEGARVLVIMFGGLWILAGIYFIYTNPSFGPSLSFLRLIMIAYGLSVIYYLRRRDVKVRFMRREVSSSSPV